MKLFLSLAIILAVLICPFYAYAEDGPANYSVE